MFDGFFYDVPLCNELVILVFEIVGREGIDITFVINVSCYSPEDPVNLFLVFF